MVVNSKANALNERKYELLLEGAKRIPDEYQSLQSQFAVVVCGRLGLRSGELVHMKSDWVNWRKRRIEIPQYQSCTRGRNNDVCGYCHQLAEQQVEYFNERTVSEQSRAILNRYIDDGFNRGEQLTLPDALQLRWSAKTPAAARSVPFDFAPRVELIIERYFDRFNKWIVSKTGLNRRLNKAMQHADELTTNATNPHGLRATAATYHAGRGLGVLPLQSLMGWADLQTAQRYIKQSPENTQRALHQIHSQ
jgi:integrase